MRTLAAPVGITSLLTDCSPTTQRLLSDYSLTTQLLLSWQVHPSVQCQDAN